MFCYMLARKHVCVCVCVCVCVHTAVRFTYEIRSEAVRCEASSSIASTPSITDSAHRQ